MICLVNEGDSITGGAYSDHCTYPWAAAGLTVDTIPGYTVFACCSAQRFVFGLNNMICLNRAIPGSRVLTNPATGSGDYSTVENYPGDLVQRGTSWTDAVLSASSAPRFATGLPDTRPVRKYILTILIGTNPDTSDPVQHAANVTAYIASRRASGWNKIMLCTLTSCTSGVIGSPGSTTFDTTYGHPYNALVRAGIAGVDQVCDFASDSRLGGTGAANDTNYFIDGTHPTTAGYNIMTPIYTAAVNALVATL